MAEKAKEKRKIKSPNVYVVLFFVLVFVAILTWIVPGGEYQVDQAGNAMAGTYTPTDANPQGFWEIVMAPIIGMTGDERISGAINISLDVMIFGSFLQVVNSTDALGVALKGVSEKFKNNQRLLITILIFFMMTLATIYGAYEEAVIYMMMIIPVIIGLGLDTMTAILITVLGTQAGNAASIINPFSTGIASGIAGIPPGDGMGYRTLIFVVLGLVLSLFINRYAESVQKNPEKSPVYHRMDEDRELYLAEDDSADKGMSKTQRNVLIIFAVAFGILILALIPWDTLDINIFVRFSEWLYSIPILGNLIGAFPAFGTWGFNAMTAWMLLLSVIAGFVANYDIDTTLDHIIKGAADLVPTALIIPMARGIQVLMESGNITATILNFGENTLSSLSPIPFVLLTLLFYLALATLMPSSSGLGAATMSIMAPLATFAGLPASIMILIFNFALGLAKMIMPTSIAAMTCTTAVGSDYADFVKIAIKPWIACFLVAGLLLILNVLIVA